MRIVVSARGGRRRKGHPRRLDPRGGWGPGEEIPRGITSEEEGAAKVRWSTIAEQHEPNYLKKNLDMHRDF